MNTLCPTRGLSLLALIPIALTSAAHADVTMEQSIRVEGTGLMSMINMSGQTVTAISGDRARTDSSLQMESRLMRMFGGTGPMAEIVRMDEEKVYQLDLKKRTFTEMTFAQQREAMQQAIDQMRDSQQSQQQQSSGIDESSCEWSEPTSTVERSGETETIAGHRAERTTVTATQSCSDPKTDQVCSFNLILDQWLAPKFEAGDEVVEYYQSYAEKLGFDVAQSPDFVQRLESMFGGYKGIWSEIADSMAGTNGYPLRSTVSLAIGGPQCQTSQEAQSAPGTAPGIGEVVGGALGGALGGMFGRRGDAARQKAPEPASEVDPTLPDGTLRLMSISSEFVSVNNDKVAPGTFEIPENFRKARD